MKMRTEIDEHLKVINNTFDVNYENYIISQANVIFERINAGGTIFFMGNGGSAADSQHLVAEFISKLKIERSALPAVALTVDTSVITAIGNDFGFNNLFSRQISALVSGKDVVVGISTSGRSENVKNGFTEAKSKGAYLIGFSGLNGMEGVELDFDFRIQSTVTARIQEAHLLLGHLLCSAVEEKFA